MKLKYDYSIYGAISRLRLSGHRSFHMPGHKAQGEFGSYFPGAELDITELPYSDNLHCPTGVIKTAQRDIAEILGAAASYITTDGSTSGVYTLMYAAAKRGGKVIVPRNSHRSVYNACRLLSIEPVIVQGEDKEGVLLAPDPSLIEKLFVNDVNISAVIITSPDYYGNVAPLGKYAEITRRYNRLLLVDGAHGAHLAFEPGRTGYCGKYADMWVDGAHKTLPTLNQGAIVNVASPEYAEVAEEALAMFRTTSPSYPIMASVEYGVKYMANFPDRTEEAKEAAAWFKSQLEGFAFYPSDDWTKVAVDFKHLGISPEYAVQAMAKRNMYAELCDGRYLLLYLSPCVTRRSLSALASVLLSVAANYGYSGSYVERHMPLPRAERTYSYLYAFKQPWEYVPLERAAGRMSAENAGINPPCIPVIVAGEIAGEAAINILKRSNGTFGVRNGCIKVIKT